MNQADVLKYGVSEEQYSLERLQHWLEYGKHSWTLGATVFFLPYGFIVTGLKIAALIFLPYMLWHLWKAKWYKSAVVLLAVVLLPFIISLSISMGNNIVYFLLSFLPLLTFFIYTYIISYMIGEELNRINTIKRWEREAMEKD